MLQKSQAAPPQQLTPEQVTRPQRSKPKQLSAFRTHLANIFQLLIKELRSIRSDPILLVLVAYAFTFAIYAAATGARTEATNLAVGVVDEDRSDLSRRIADGLTPPTFQPAVAIAATEIDSSMESQRFVFVLEIPPKFQADIGRAAAFGSNQCRCHRRCAGVPWNDIPSERDRQLCLGLCDRA